MLSLVILACCLHCRKDQGMIWRIRLKAIVEIPMWQNTVSDPIACILVLSYPNSLDLAVCKLILCSRSFHKRLSEYIWVLSMLYKAKWNRMRTRHDT